MFEKLLKLFNKNKNKDKDKQIKNDVLGSYTGVAEDPYEMPEQDADDL